MLPNHERLSAARVTPVARHFGQRYNVDLPLILAIIKNESAFNPRAQSHIPAFGLMQLVPASGGRDAFKLVEGQDRAPSPDYLFQPNRNIELGVAYLHILDTRYLRAIRDERSRRHCMIAAYNTGAGNVARAFGGSTNVNSAARQINRLSPDAVYRHLVANLPYRETRQYLPKVVRDQDTFATL
jgi:membrane-bound lytic murein transglycosylase C